MTTTEVKPKNGAFKGNFAHFPDEPHEIAQLGKMAQNAERVINIYPLGTIMGMRQVVELITKQIQKYDNLPHDEKQNQWERLEQLRLHPRDYPSKVVDAMDFVRVKGNKAVHEGVDDAALHQLARNVDTCTFFIAQWFLATYTLVNTTAFKYHEPLAAMPKMRQLEINENDEIVTTNQPLAENETKAVPKFAVVFEAKSKAISQAIDKQPTKEVTKEERASRRQKSEAVMLSLQKLQIAELSEEEVREYIIDKKLALAGWEVDSKNLTHAKVGKPAKGKRQAIAEWQIAGKKLRADYVLFDNQKAVGIVEAKKTSESPLDAMRQAKEYAQTFGGGQDSENAQYLTDYVKNHPECRLNVPFIFATNGRQFRRLDETRTGVHFWDGRNSHNSAVTLASFMKPDDLKLKLQAGTSLEQANENLKNDLRIPQLASRNYQHEAIRAVEDAIIAGRRRILLSMATGTGKTRTAIALMYRLLKAKRVRRILYLVDRTTLAQQTQEAMGTIIENQKSIMQIYGVTQFGKDEQNKKVDGGTRIRIETVQGIMTQLQKQKEYLEAQLNANEMPNEANFKAYLGGKTPLTAGTFDFIVVDEAHRGYNEDSEMSQNDLKHYNQQEYVSRYREVIDYFDAVALGLTATPAPQTERIFGKPVYSYDYAKAVRGGYLMDHNAPIEIKTALQTSGMHLNAGQTVAVHNAKDAQLKDVLLPDQIDFDVESFNRKVVNNNTTAAICEKIAAKINPLAENRQGKTLIFAVDDAHADRVVAALRAAYHKILPEFKDEMVAKITSALRPKQVKALVKSYKTEKMPNIVVTVNLMATGVDVPQICNLVFMRRVNSRILYEQMLGRATRLSDKVACDHFEIYDAAGQYEAMQNYTAMNSVINKKTVKRTIKDYCDYIKNTHDDEQLAEYRTQLVARLQRKIQGKAFDEVTKQQLCQAIGALEHETTPSSLREWVAALDGANKARLVEAFAGINLILNVKANDLTYFTDEADHVVSVQKVNEPDMKITQDHMHAFGEYMKSLRADENKSTALAHLFAQPQLLTLTELNQIKAQLAADGFRLVALEAMYQAKYQRAKVRSVDVMRFAAGITHELVAQDEKINHAVAQVAALADWDKKQTAWLKRLENQLAENGVLGPDAPTFFNTMPLFKQRGGYLRFKQLLGAKIDDVILTINAALYENEK